MLYLALHLSGCRSVSPRLTFCMERATLFGRHGLFGITAREKEDLSVDLGRGARFSPKRELDQSKILFFRISGNQHPVTDGRQL